MRSRCSLARRPTGTRERLSARAGAAALATKLSSHTRYPKEEKQTLPETAKGEPRRGSVGGGPTAGEVGTQGLGAGPRLARVERRHGGGATTGEDGAQGLGAGQGGTQGLGAGPQRTKVGLSAWGRGHGPRGRGAVLGGGAMAARAGRRCGGGGASGDNGQR